MSDCATEACGRPATRRDWCNAHYQRGMKDGSIKPLTITDRFWRKVNKTDTCWLWTGAISNGYGTFSSGSRGAKRTVYAHRRAYEMLAGPIPPGLHLDHLCRVPRCINPAHLEPVTPRENMLRGMATPARCIRANACDRGHEYTPENTLIISTSGRRQCRACNRMRYLRRLARLAGSVVEAA